MKRLVLILLLACVLTASVFSLAYSLGVSALFAREKQTAADEHYGVITLLPETAPEFDPAVNAWLTEDPRRSLIPILREDALEQLKKHSDAYPIHFRYMTLGVSEEYRRLPPPAGYYDYADRLVVEAAVQSVTEDLLMLTDCVFLGGRGEAMADTLTVRLPEELADTWSAGDRAAFSLRVWQEEGTWRCRADKELVPKGGTKPEEAASMAEDNLHGFDMVFTEDMGWIRRVMQGRLRCIRGRLIERTDAGSRVCVVSERFLQENGLALGDSLSFRVGDKLCAQFAPIGAIAYTTTQYPRRWAEKTLEIIGTYEDPDNGSWTADEFAWAYSENTVFVPLSELPETVYRSSARYTPAELTLLPAGGDTLERKGGWMQEIAAGIGLRCEMDDRGWPEIAAGIAGEEADLRSRTLPILLAGAAGLLLFSPVCLLSARRTCAVLRLAGVPKKRLLLRTLGPAFLLLWASAGVGAAGAGLLLRSRMASFQAEWAAFLPAPEPDLPLGVVLLVPAAAGLVLSGGLVPAVRGIMGKDVHILADRMQRKAGGG